MVARSNITKGQVWDFGCSTGRGLRAASRGAIPGDLTFLGCDNSLDMVNRTKATCPWATVFQHDLRGGLPAEVEVGEVKVAIFGYVLQFIQDLSIRRKLLKDAFEALDWGGMLFIMEKYEDGHVGYDDVMQDAYVGFRLMNGYSRAEIDAKTQALENAMWPCARGFTLNALRAAGADRVLPIYSSLNFGGYVAFKSR